MDPIIDIMPNGTIHATYYTYQPSAPAAWTFVVLFATATITHFILVFLFKAAYFLPLIIGGIMETFAYYGRAWSSRIPDNIKPWILQALLIMAAPPMISATVYMTLGRLVRTLKARENAIMGPRATTCLFVFGDVVAFFSQLAGTGLQASTSHSVQETGGKVVLGGLVFQLLLLSFFVVSTAAFHKRTVQNPTIISGRPQLLPWRHTIYILYAASVCILIRNIVRAAEFAQGPKGTVAGNEAFVYVFDGALIWLVMVAFFVAHPGRLFKEAKRARSGVDADTVEMLLHTDGEGRR